MTLAASRLEARPWRLVWRCWVCGESSTVRVSPEARSWLAGLLRPGGMLVSAFEADELEAASTDEVSAAFVAELLR